MKTEIRTITPEDAKTLLESNEKNRKFSKPYAKRIAAEMKAGIWHETHQGIAIDVEGHIIDGQHRLAAIVDSGMKQTMVVTSELPADAYKYIDIGKRRSAADRLREDPQVADVASFILRMTDGTQSAGRIKRLEQVRDMVRDTALYAKEIFQHKQRPFGSSGARSAFVIAIDALNADQEYAEQQFDALSHYNFEAMSERSQNLVKRIAKGQFPAHTQAQRIELCYAVAACLTYQRGKTLSMSQGLIDAFVRNVREHYGEANASKEQRKLSESESQ